MFGFGQRNPEIRADITEVEVIEVVKMILDDAHFFPNTFGGDMGRVFDSFPKALIKIIDQGEGPASAIFWAENREPCISLV